MYSLDVLLFLFGTSLLVHVPLVNLKVNQDLYPLPKQNFETEH